MVTFKTRHQQHLSDLRPTLGHPNNAADLDDLSGAFSATTTAAQAAVAAFVQQIQAFEKDYVCIDSVTIATDGLAV
jgi:hypothetical protein